MNKLKIVERLKRYHFEFKHLTVLFIILISFQIIISFIHKTSLKRFLINTQEWYQQHSAERVANLTTTTLELLLETVQTRDSVNDAHKRKIIQFFNVILSQQIIQSNIEQICILIDINGSLYSIDDGEVLYSILFDDRENILVDTTKYSLARKLFLENRDKIIQNEEILSLLEEKNTYHIFVPFLPKGEVVGAVYMKNMPDFSFITYEIISNYEEITIIYSVLIILGLIAMYYISSYTLKERNEVQKKLLEENARSLKQKIEHDKESLFTKRIYHTHHKAEKVMGFIKEDIRKLSINNINEIKYRVIKYSNFISRIIYNMKWYDPPIQTIRNNAFKTNINEVITFIVDNILLRTTTKLNNFEVILDLDQNIPSLPINEYVIWEVIEPLIQNSIDHNPRQNLRITIHSINEADKKRSLLVIADNGRGIAVELLEKDKSCIKKVFLENVTTKKNEIQNNGYGCYIAYEISKQRCGWEIDAENIPEGGCKFMITIPH